MHIETKESVSIKNTTVIQLNGIEPRCILIEVLPLQISLLNLPNVPKLFDAAKLPTTLFTFN